MQASFTDLVGTAIVPAHCFDSSELTDLTPALDTPAADHDVAAQASAASQSHMATCGPGSFGLSSGCMNP